ncbi:hypothetical protein AX14_012256 [Amanita brunnescens Koide BX004]|nr:hypothetical protein AX14_012256 [Amanita brunnescens Koide BX004]
MPYAVGLHAAATAFLSSGFSIQFAVAVFLLLVIVVLISQDKSEPDDPVCLPCWSLFNIMPFFRKRYDFLNWGFEATGQDIYQFKLLNNTVVVVSGESGRHGYFTAKGLDLTEGFKILSGAIPMVKGITSDLQTKRVAIIHKRLAGIQRHAPLSDLVPMILEDTRMKMQSWGAAGTFDPFDKIYELVFQTTVRCLSSHEISDDPVLVARLKLLYDTLDTGTTPTTVLLPWLPFPSMIKKLLATKEIYEIIVNAINNREKSRVYRNDTLQMLLDSGDEKLVVVGFIMGLIIAGARATGTTASWLITFLGGHPEWHDKAAAEVRSLLGFHSQVNSKNAAVPSLSAQLAGIPLDVWESETPVLDAIIKETTRVAQPHTAMRRNLGPEFYIDKKRIPTGAYVVYPFSDVHLNPQLYPDPWKFDPGRPEVKGTSFAYVGWGGGL